MNLVILFLIGLLVSNAQEIGICKVKGTEKDPGIKGTVLFIKNGPKIEMQVDVQGITVNPNKPHGIHIHQFGDLTSDDGMQTGTHWNPTNASHRCIGERHYGDTGNWEVSEGNIKATKILDLLALSGGNSIIGMAVIIHSQTDDCETIASAGSRLGQCVIGIANPSIINATANYAEGSGVYPKTPQKAICVFEPTSNDPKIGGWVLFEQESLTSPVVVTAMVKHLARASVHALHIHEFGDLRSPDGMGTGSHWNPTKSEHGIPPHPVRHVGDLGNVYYYDSDGVAYYTYSFENFGLSGSAHSILGHAVILHVSSDVCTQPVGGAGARMAQCVIGISNPNTKFSIPKIPSNQDYSACPPAPSTGFLPSTQILVIIAVVGAVIIYFAYNRGQNEQRPRKRY